MKKLSIQFLLVFTFCLSHLYAGAIPGKFIVKWRSDLQQNHIDRVTNSTISKGMKLVDIDKKARLSEINIDKKSLSTELVQNLKSSLASSIEWMEPVFKLKAYKLPTDKEWFTQWSFKNYGQRINGKGVEGKVGVDVKALQAWKINRGSKDVVVAVVDTGIDYTHEDLMPNMWINKAEQNGLEGVDDDGNGYTDDVVGWNFHELDSLYYGNPGHPDAMDDNGHGTHCAGTIGAVPNNGIGVAGINWNVSLMALKFLGGSGSGSTVGAYRAIKYAADNGADVINASWGGGEFSRLLKESIEYAQEKGVLFVAAAGNSSSNNDNVQSYPATYDVSGILSVAATDNQDELAYFSSYGAKSVHIAAPGVHIMSTIPGNQYDVFSGTSMATPHVAGAAALVLAHDPSLKNRPLDLKKRLMSTVDRVQSLQGRVVAGGRLNLLSALKDKRLSERKGKWVTVDFAHKSVSYPKERVNEVIRIKFPGAVAYKVHFKYAELDTGFDELGLFDSSFKRIMTIPETIAGQWSPAVWSNEVYLNFSNAIVAEANFFGELLDDPYPNDMSAGYEIDKVSYFVEQTTKERK